MNNKERSAWTVEIPFSYRWKLCLVAWVIGLVAAGFPNPALIMYLWFFPLGLLEVTGWRFGGQDSEYVVGWFCYTLITVFALMARPRLLYFTLFGVLCILLLLNAAGCQHMMARVVEKTH